MNTREKDLVRYTLSYLATGDGRRARSDTRTNLSNETRREIRRMADRKRGAIVAHVFKVMR